MGLESPELLCAEGDVPARGPLRKTVGLRCRLQHNRILSFLWRAVELALVEADEREIELTASEITSRLFNAYERGVRDEDELKDAIVLNFPTVYLQ